MPYKNISSLPPGVRNHLPKAAQEIYLEAYNAAHEQYKDSSKRRDDATLEETAARVAWAAVKSKYHKNEKGMWVKN